MDSAPSSETIRTFDLLIADDDYLICDAIKFALEASGQFKVASAGSLGDLLEKAAQKPDVILLDLNMPGMAGLQSITSVVQAFPNAKVVLFSGQTEPTFLKAAIDVGARGFIPKTLPLAALTSALHLVKAGQTFVPSSLLAAAIGDLNRERYGGLSRMEFQVLKGIAAGKRNKEIAWELGTTEVAVKMHVRGIFAKLEARNRTFAVLIAQQRGIL